MQTTIKRYIRNAGTNEPRGVVVAVRKDDEIRYGFSLVNVNAEKFDKEEGIRKATYRALSEKGFKLPTVPDRMEMVEEALEHIEKQATKYFKDVDKDKIKMSKELIKRAGSLEHE